MRTLLLAFAAASTIAPIPAGASEDEGTRIAEELRDPATQAEIEGSDPEAVDPSLTVRDIAGPEAEAAPREIALRLPQMMGALAALAVSLERMLPQLEAMGDTLAHPDTADDAE
ncbi:MAG TPA: hypothetical protein VFS49_00660 [Croceibacterium sp.]|nr:hypothetical protein [Croceibacterium sp.]